MISGPTFSSYGRASRVLAPVIMTGTVHRPMELAIP